jgi:hypothetical protein
MAKTKKSIIKKIKTIISEFGIFGSGEVEPNNSPLVNEMGGLIGLAEYFRHNSVEVSVYDTSSMSSDSIHDYEVKYEDLSINVLEEILFIAEQYEAEQIKTEKRITN